MRREDEFREFVVTAWPGLVRLARLLTPRADAEDLVQTALERTYTHWNALREPQAATAYTRTVLTRLAIRASKRRWRGEVAHESLPESAAEPAFDDVDTAEAVRRALAQLSRDQRVVLVLRFYGDLTETAIADVLRCRPGTVKSRLHRALTELRTRGLLDDLQEATDG